MQVNKTKLREKQVNYLLRGLKYGQDDDTGDAWEANRMLDNHNLTPIARETEAIERDNWNE